MKTADEYRIMANDVRNGFGIPEKIMQKIESSAQDGYFMCFCGWDIVGVKPETYSKVNKIIMGLESRGFYVDWQSRGLLIKWE